MDAVERGDIATLGVVHKDRLARFEFDYFDHLYGVRRYEKALEDELSGEVTG